MFYLFICIAFINFLDGAVTYFGFSSEAIEKANPIMRHLYVTDPLLFLLVKTGISMLLLLFYMVIRIPKTQY
jgi:hypothetical protein